MAIAFAVAIFVYLDASRLNFCRITSFIRTIVEEGRVGYADECIKEKG